MIHIHLRRDRDVGLPNHQSFDQGVRDETVFAALRLLILSELQFGANVTHLSATQLHLQTRICGDLDTTEFSGSQTEMRPLLEAIRVFRQHCRPALVIATDLIEMLEHLPHGTAADRGFQTMLMPFATCNEGLQLCLLTALGATSDQELAIGTNMKIQDLFCAFELMQETGMSLAQVIATA